MKRFIFAALIAFVPVNAFAGSVTISVTNAANGTVSKTFTVPDADLVRWVAAYQVAANASVNATATRAQVLNYIATSMMQEWINAVKAFESTAATAAAAAAVAPITAN